MILNCSGRTDIPAFYSDWFFNRIKEGFVLVRNPYYPSELLHIELNKDTVDLLVFCTKNPRPMLKRMNELNDFNVYYMVTITPYGKDLEPSVPLVKSLIKDVVALSKILGKDHVVVRYDPIIINQKYTVDYHIHCFEKLMSVLSGAIEECIISFVDLYAKSKIFNEVSYDDRNRIAEAFGKIGKQYSIKIKTCAEVSYEKYGIQKSGCLSRNVIEKLLNTNILDLDHIPARTHCNCVASRDIGEYDTCLHECIYCYATDHMQAKKNYQLHDPLSPVLIGHVNEEDTIKKINQASLIDPQLSLFWGDL